MSNNISEDEVDALLKGNASEPQSTKEESLEKLLEEIMSTAPSAPAASALSPERAPLFATQTEKQKKNRYLPLWLSSAVLGAFLLGGAFGFYWGKNDPSAPTLKALQEGITQLTDQVNRLVKAMEPPSTASSEIIEPLPSPIKKKAKEAIL